jgi:hypothetical protein
VNGALKRVGLGILTGAGLIAIGALVLPYVAIYLWYQGIVWGWW